MAESLTPTKNGSTHALQRDWVDRIFARLLAMYGAKFTQQWQAVAPDVLQAVWAEDLAGYTGDEIKRGLEACKTRQWPPTLPEFCGLCRPQLDTHALLHIAIREMSNRRNRQPEHWPDSRTFWAAQKIGSHDMLGLPAEKLQKRFELAWFESYADKDKPIPKSSEASALPAPGKTTISKEDAKDRLQKLADLVGKFGNERKWAFAIADRPDAYPAVSVSAAIAALTTWRVEIPVALHDSAVKLGLIKLPSDDA